MLNTVLVIAVILIVAILVIVFRVSTLVQVVKKKEEGKVPNSNKIQASLMLAFLVFGLIGSFYFSFGGLDDNFNQPIASEHGVVTERLFWVTMAITGIVFVITQIFLFGFAYKYQKRDGQKATFYPHNDRLEVIWTAVPAVVLAVLILTGWKAWVDITAPAPEDAEVIEVMGYQYSWAVRYPGADKKLGGYDYRKTDVSNISGVDFSDRASFDDFYGLQLHVPKGKPVLLNIRARDVIHSFYSPHFRLQMNAVPGMPTKFWFVPTKSTAEMRLETGNPDFNYELVCNKICGKGHFGMKYLIVVDEPEDYKKWYSEQEPWLKQNPDYLADVPAELREQALITLGLENIEEEQQVAPQMISTAQ